MNATVAGATCDNLLFMHADSRLEDHELLRNALRIRATETTALPGISLCTSDRAPLIFYPIRRSKLRY